MDNILLIFICLLAGILLRRSKAVPANAHVALNQFVINISLPALALYYIPKIEFTAALLYPAGMAWIAFGLSWLFFAGLGKWLGWSKRLTGCLILTGGLCNTSFVGFPVIEALYGQAGLEAAIVVDQPGSFVVVSTVGVAVALAYSGGSAASGNLFRKILLFPPFIAFFIAVAMNAVHLDFADYVQPVWQKLGSTVTPVALISTGLQLRIQRRSRHWGFLALGLCFKLLLLPGIIYILYRKLLGGKGLAIDVSIMEAAMAPMITAAILASAYRLKPKLAGMMIGVGIPLSFVTLTFWYWILRIF